MVYLQNVTEIDSKCSPCWLSYKNSGQYIQLMYILWLSGSFAHNAVWSVFSQSTAGHFRQLSFQKQTSEFVADNYESKIASLWLT